MRYIGVPRPDQAARSMPKKPAPPPFVHLRLHSDYSIRDGLAAIKPLAAACREKRMPAVAVTDLANMFGLIRFHRSAVAAGVKPVCGCDVPVDGPGGRTRLALLAMNREGYGNLRLLVSALYAGEGGPDGPALDKAELDPARVAGLIALSGAQRSDIGEALADGEADAARARLEEWRGLFPDRFYLELQRVGRPGEGRYIEAAVELALETGCPVVATNDVRFLEAGDFDAHEARICIHDKTTLNDGKRPRRCTERQYLKSGEEMAALFEDLPEALANSVEIARRCSLHLPRAKPALPDYPVPDGVSLEDYLRSESRRGLDGRLAEAGVEGRERTALYHRRLDEELAVINQMGFPGYFLIVMEFIQWARDAGIPVGPGRGSGAGSIVAWSLGITGLDPIHYGLLFERFLNPERESLPDFDIDFCVEGRDRVLQHVRERYGQDAVCQIITFGTLAAKAAVRDVTRVQDKPYGLGDELAGMISDAPGVTLEQAVAANASMKTFIDGSEEAQEIMAMARRLEGIVRNAGKHPGGVVIAPGRLTDFAPLYRDEEGNLMTQFDKDDVEEVGLVKFDFLGLTTLTVIDRAVAMINARHGAGAVDPENLPLDDEKVYRLLQSGETTSVFQLESASIRGMIRRLKPSRFEDIIALVALHRPGPMDLKMDDTYIGRKHGHEKVAYLHKKLEPILSETYGVILYQEQVMRIAQELAGYTLGEADGLRAAMSKKKQDAMDRQRGAFVEGATAAGVAERTAKRIFAQIETFAGYGFNKSHAAVYALLAWRTAWLKTHYPAFYMAAVLTAEKGDSKKLLAPIEECRAMGIRILPPDVNSSGRDFTVSEDGAIVYGLGAVKGAGARPVDVILAARGRGGPFAGLTDLCRRVDPQLANRQIMQALINAGALDCLADGGRERHAARALLMAGLPAAVEEGRRFQEDARSGQGGLFGEAEPGAAAGDGGGDGGGDGERPFEPWTELECLEREKTALGFYLSGHPADVYQAELDDIVKTPLDGLRPDGDPQLVAGLLVDSRMAKGKSGSMVRITLDDGRGRFEIALFDKELDRYRNLIRENKGRMLVAECTVSPDERNGGVRGRAGRLMTLAGVRRRHARHLRLRLRGADCGRDFCERLGAMLKAHRPEREAGAGRAGCPVVVDYENARAKGCIMLDEAWRVAPDDGLIQRLRLEFGRDAVRVKYNRPIMLG